MAEQVKLRARYADGYKYCPRCQLYYKTESKRCPVCRTLLRCNPRKRDEGRDGRRVMPPREVLEAVEAERLLVGVAVPQNRPPQHGP